MAKGVVWKIRFPTVARQRRVPAILVAQFAYTGISCPPPRSFPRALLILPEDFQFSILRLLIIRAGRTQVVSFAATRRAARLAGCRADDFRTRLGIEGPFVNSPNAWLRLRAGSSRGRASHQPRSLWYCWIRLKYFTLGNICRAYVLRRRAAPRPSSPPPSCLCLLFLPHVPRETLVNVLTRRALVSWNTAFPKYNTASLSANLLAQLHFHSVFKVHRAHRVVLPGEKFLVKLIIRPCFVCRFLTEFPREIRRK